MRLKIGKNGQYLHLRRGTGIQLDMQSPLYFGDRSTEAFQGLKAYSIAVPANNHNRLLLNRPEALDNPSDFLDEDGWQIFYDDYLLLEGKLEVEDGLYDGDINITFYGGLAGNLTALKETYLQQVDYGDEITLGADDSEVILYANTLAGDPATSPFVFPSVRIHKDGDPDDTDLPQAYQYLNLYQSNSYQRSSTVAGHNVRSTLSPQLRARYVLEKALAAVDYTLAGIFDSHDLATELDDLLVFNINTLDRITDEPSDPVSFDDMSLRTSIDLKDYVPQVTAAEYIRSLCNLFCLAPVIDVAQRRLILVSQDNLVDAPYVHDFTEKVNPDYIRSRALEDIPQEFIYEHINEAYAQLHNNKEPGNLDYITYADYATARAAILLDPNYVFRYIYITSLNEFFEANNYPRGQNTFVNLTRKGKDLGIINEYSTPSYSPNADTLHMTHRYEYAGDPVLFRSNQVDEYMPCFFDDIISPMSGGNQLTTLIFLIYRGMQPGESGAAYPLAASGRYRWDETTVGELSLLWREMYEKWWSRWMDLLRAMRPVQYITYFNASDISTLDWRRKVRIAQHTYFMKRVQVTLTTDEIKPAVVEYMQIN